MLVVKVDLRLKRSMSASGTKRQFARCKAMSGVGGKADLPVERPDFSLGPKAKCRDVRSRAAVGGEADIRWPTRSNRLYEYAP